MTVEIRKICRDETRKVIEAALAKNNNYCPCKVDKIEENKCMCKDFREMNTSGFCRCGLYEKLIHLDPWDAEVEK